MSAASPHISGETPILLIRTHWMQYAMPVILVGTSWLLYFLCTALSLAFMGWNEAAGIAALIGGHALLLLFHHAAFYQIFSMSTTRFLVTNKRVVGMRQRLWLSDETIDVPLWKIRSMEVSKKGLLQHVLDYGSILLNRGTLPSIGLIRHPNLLHNRISIQLHQLQHSPITHRPGDPPPMMQQAV